jgi:citrate synthase
MLAMFDKDRMDNTYEGTRRKGIRLIAQLPTIVAMHHRFRKSLPYVQSSSTFSHVANVLYLLQDAKPSAKHEKIVDRNLMLHAEHSSNASSFTARVVSGTQADIHAAITSAIAAFSGPLHGGAIEHTMKMLREIGEPELASAYIKARIERKEPIMGFGHRVYRTDDPRAKHLRQSIQELSHELQDYKWLAILDEVVAAMQPYSRHGIHVNVDFYACVIYHLLGLPEDLFVPLFVLGRIAGWVAHVLEQWENNILIRPIMQYTGRESRPYVPMVGRKSL